MGYKARRTDRSWLAPGAIRSSLTTRHRERQVAHPLDGVQPEQPPPLPASAWPSLWAAKREIVRAVFRLWQRLHWAGVSASVFERSISNVALQSRQ
jgi:hypothetical protein